MHDAHAAYAYVMSKSVLMFDYASGNGSCGCYYLYYCVWVVTVVTTGVLLLSNIVFIFITIFNILLIVITFVM